MVGCGTPHAKPVNGENSVIYYSFSGFQEYSILGRKLALPVHYRLKGPSWQIPLDHTLRIFRASLARSLLEPPARLVTPGGLHRNKREGNHGLYDGWRSTKGSMHRKTFFLPLREISHHTRIFSGRFPFHMAGIFPTKKTVISICSLPHQTRSLNRIVCREQEGPTGSKDTLGTRQILALCFFNKPMSLRNRKEVVRISRYS